MGAVDTDALAQLMMQLQYEQQMKQNPAAGGNLDPYGEVDPRMAMDPAMQGWQEARGLGGAAGAIARGAGAAAKTAPKAVPKAPLPMPAPKPPKGGAVIDGIMAADQVLNNPTAGITKPGGVGDFASRLILRGGKPGGGPLGPDGPIFGPSTRRADEEKKRQEEAKKKGQ